MGEKDQLPGITNIWSSGDQQADGLANGAAEVKKEQQGEPQVRPEHSRREQDAPPQQDAPQQQQQQQQPGGGAAAQGGGAWQTGEGLPQGAGNLIEAYARFLQSNPSQTAAGATLGLQPAVSGGNLLPTSASWSAGTMPRAEVLASAMSANDVLGRPNKVARRKEDLGQESDQPIRGQSLVQGLPLATTEAVAHMHELEALGDKDKGDCDAERGVKRAANGLGELDDAGIMAAATTLMATASSRSVGAESFASFSDNEDEEEDDDEEAAAGKQAGKQAATDVGEDDEEAFRYGEDEDEDEEYEAKAKRRSRRRDEDDEDFRTSAYRRTTRVAGRTGSVRAKRSTRGSAVTRRSIVGGSDKMFKGDYGTSWYDVTTTGKPAASRQGHAAVFIDGGYLLIIGGGVDNRNESKLNDDVMALNLSSLSWLMFGATGEPLGSRHGHSAATWKDRVLLYGGRGFDQTIYSLDPTPMVWSKVASQGPPHPGVVGHSMVLDTRNEVFLFFGGSVANSSSTSNAVSVLDMKDGAKWTSKPTTGAVPNPLRDHVAIYHEPSHSMYVYGGETVGAHGSLRCVDQLHKLDLETWTWSLAASSAPMGQRSQLTAACVGDTMYLHGGLTIFAEKQTGTRDLWACHLPTLEWTLLSGKHTDPAVAAEAARTQALHSSVAADNARASQVSATISAEEAGLQATAGRIAAEAAQMILHQQAQAQQLRVLHEQELQRWSSVQAARYGSNLSALQPIEQQTLQMELMQLRQSQDLQQRQLAIQHAQAQKMISDAQQQVAMQQRLVREHQERVDFMQQQQQQQRQQQERTSAGDGDGDGEAGDGTSGSGVRGKRAPPRPAARFCHSMTPVGNSLVIFGGRVGMVMRWGRPSCHKDLWIVGLDKEPANEAVGNFLDSYTPEFPVQLAKRRNRLSKEQQAMLLEAFAANPSPSATDRSAISSRVGLAERTVKTWFQNMRAKRTR